MIGNIGSYVDEDRREVGYWLGREYWGRGHATAALALFLTEARERPLFAHVAAHNRGGARVLAKCGFVLLASAEDGAADEVLLRLGGRISISDAVSSSEKSG